MQLLLVGYMGAGQCDTIGHARLLRQQPQPHQRSLQAAIRPNDTCSALRPCQHRGRQLAAFHLKGDRNAPHGCGSGCMRAQAFIDTTH